VCTLATCLLASGCDVAASGGHAATSLRLIVLPDAGAGAVLALMSAARARLWVEMYLLTSEAAIELLAARARAGAEVRVLLEPAPYLNPDANAGAYRRLAMAGVDVRWTSERFRYSHAKMLIIDDVRLVVMTLNLTDAGLGGNREYVVVDDDPVDVEAAAELFAADQVGAVAVGGGRVVTSPDATRSVFGELIDGATRSLRWQSEELAEPRILAALGAAQARGVAVSAVWPGPASAGSATLAAAGVDLRLVKTPAIHAKAAVADGGRCYVGSANLSPTSLDANREVGLRLDDPALCGAIDATVLSDAARGVSP
jgi:phosphatidylserine/phosphatidylglycerophosphate/cardiolipin synthase-like enzyme